MDHNKELHLLALEKVGRPLPGVELQLDQYFGKWRWRKHDGTYVKRQSGYQFESLMEALNASHK